MSRLNILFTPDAFEDYKYWQIHDKKLLKKINQLIKCINRNGPLEGEGKPEDLKGNFKGYYSRRINFEHRLVYKVHDSEIIIVSCKYHYFK
ncbi:Txe/YoeB family addiction module toxin [Staphylococcus warneri]|uniref:Txe/YoeB family addiction module toxin n=1 Tax=Staphylococcus warneri TaxID=1292 RepID=UPI000F528739|nr:Txe/YoeB family addiction module toxin [Staphylococcus warneri]MCI2789653.1 Txe/YoeB family addiction module toxin [Staphylococcus warneri]RQM97995.1 Txe/YoeB family addiction module toxin [Staphylococcus warneri]